MFCKHTKTVD